MTNRTPSKRASPAQPPASGSSPYEADRFYGVDLARVTRWKGQALLPAHGLELRGDVLNALDPGDIADARPL